MRNRFCKSIIRGGRSQGSFTAQISIAVDMMLDRQVESTRINWLQQQNNVAQNFSVTRHHQPASYYMPELAAMFEKCSGEPDTFPCHSHPTCVGNDDLASSDDVLGPGTEFGDDKVPGSSGPGINRYCKSSTVDCQVAVKETAAMEVNEVVVLDNENDDDWFFVDDFESFAEKDSSGKRKAAFLLAEDCNNEERTVAAAMESMGCEGTSSKNAAAVTSKTSENKKPGKVRGRIKCPESLLSKAENRRQKIHDKLRCLGNTIPWSNKDNKSKTDLLDEIIIYLKYLENQYLLLLAEPGSQNNPTSVIKTKNFTPKKKSPPAANANFGHPQQQATADFIAETERQLAFAPWGSSTSAAFVYPIRIIHCSGVALYYICCDPKTLGPAPSVFL